MPFGEFVHLHMQYCSFANSILKTRHFHSLINGNQTTLSTDLTVAEYLEQNNYQTNRIVVELNEEILPKYLYSETRLKDGDSMEIVTFVGGG